MEGRPVPAFEKEEVGDNRPVVEPYQCAFLSTSISIPLSNKSATLFQFLGTVSQKQKDISVICLKDDGASHNFISQQFLEKHSLKVKKINQQVQIIHPDQNKDTAPIQDCQTCEITLNLQDQYGEIIPFYGEFEVVTLGTYDLILDKP